jgi:hypothetical protein
MVYYDHSFALHNSQLVNEFDGAGGVFAPHPSTAARDLKQDRVTYFKKTAKFSFDLSVGLYCGNNCGLTAMSLAVAKGFKEIYLVGMDARFNVKMTKSHFHDDYKRATVPNGEHVYEAFATFFEFAGRHLKETRPDVTIYNCSKISLIDIDEEYFKRIDIRELLYDARTRHDPKGKSEVREALQGSP